MTHTTVTKEELVEFLSEVREDIIISIGDDTPILQDIDAMLHRCAIDEEEED